MAGICTATCTATCTAACAAKNRVKSAMVALIDADSGQIKGRVSIDGRPDIVNQRSRIGGWEVDTVVGKRGAAALVSLVERKSRLSVIAKVASQSAQNVEDAIVTQPKPLASEGQTLTYDNGKDFAYHQRIGEDLDASGYFAHPYHSWERDLNENTNGLIRQYFPKGQNLAAVSDAEVWAVMEKLNNRPRKCHGFKTPNQVFFGIDPPIELAN
ncbi:Integrase core domain-containing protein [Geoalkalibacter ferrihydriticus]|uniref:Integrase core domain-containing protein n=2 Tax=Geoalkalibacter ferrihydriticus TaxID=392333 RepID=A0A1G9WIS0_9BACT|nr:Integrase core domain-containing protein [Geoalkalibacter ferrihydriticus]